LIQLHPQVSRIYHENFLLKRCNNKKDLLQFVSNRGIDINSNWGEKVPYFPSARKYPIIKYCQTWNEYFGKNSRILHIVRHPYDVALSNVKKFKNINSVDKPIKLYRGIMSKTIVEIGNMESTYTFKYEDLLLHPDEMLFTIYEYCGLKPDINFRKLMKKIANPRYQSIDPSRAFAYKQKQIKWKYNIKEVINLLNKINGTNYGM
jgi:hypothetical protein